MGQLRATIWAAIRSREGAITLLTIAGVFSAVQSATPSIIGIDGYYHIRVAALMREHGPRLDFPWLQLTILNPARYADHHFLFHALQVPFTFGDLRTGAKMASVLFATLGLYISYLFLAGSKVRYTVFWLLVMLAASQTFLWRQSMARPQGLFLALMVLGTWASLSNRPWLLIPIGWAAAWTFDGFPFILAMPLASVGALVALWLISRPSNALREQWRLIGANRRPALLACTAAALGIGLGLVTHPYFPRHFEFAMLHLLPKAQVGIELDVRVGGEWYPFPWSGFPQRVGPSIVLCALGLIPPAFQLWRRQLPDWRGVALGGLALGLLGMTIRSQRIIEYLPPFAAFFCAWGWSRGDLPIPTLLVPPFRLVSRWAVPLLCVGVFAGLLWTVMQARRDARGAFAWDLPRGAAEWLVANTPPGSRVFFPAFDDFPRLFYWDTHNTYLVGLDPTYMTLYDPQLFALWRQVAQGRVASPSGPIQEVFGASYVYTQRSRAAFVSSVTADPRFEMVHSTSNTLVFRLRPAS
jgi:hypothetical protein